MSATFRGKTQLDTSGMRRGLAQMRRDIRKFSKEVNRMSGKVGAPVKPRYQLIRVHYRPNLESLKSAFVAGKRMADTFRQSVAAPFRELAANMERTIRRASLAALAISGLGVRNVFQYEAIQEQFTVLMKDSAAAKKRVQELADLAKQSPFSLTQYVQAAKTLYAVGNEALGTNEMIQKVGDSAAAMGVDMWQASIWVARLYNSLKSGSGVGTTADDMMRAGMLTAENYAKMVTGSRRGMPFEDLWALAMKDLSRFEGGMDRMSKTGTGSFMKLRDNIHMASIDMFGGMADSLKDVLYTMNEKMASMFKTGTFKEWGAKIGDMTRKSLNFIGRLIETWKRLAPESKAAMKKILIYGGAFVAGMRTGLIQPLVSLTSGLVQTAFAGMGFIGKSAVAATGLVMTAVKPLFSLAVAGIKGLVPLASGLFKSLIANANPAFQLLFSKIAMLKALPAILATGVGGWGIGRILGEMLNPAELDKRITAARENQKEMKRMMDEAGTNDKLMLYQKKYLGYLEEENRLRKQAEEVKLNPWKAARNVLKRELIDPLYHMTGSLFDKGMKTVKDKGGAALNALAGQFMNKMKAIIAKGAGISLEDFNRVLDDLKKTFESTKGFEWLKAPKLPSIRKQLQTKEALDDIRKIYMYTLRGIYAGGRGFRFANSRNGGFAKFKTFAKRRNVRRLDSQLDGGPSAPDRGNLAGRSDVEPAPAPVKRRTVPRIDLSPLVPSYMRKFAPFAVPHIFRKPGWNPMKPRRPQKINGVEINGKIPENVESAPSRSPQETWGGIPMKRIPWTPANYRKAVPHVDLSGMVPSYMPKFAPFAIPKIFGKAHDPASIIAGAMTPKTGPKQEPKAPKEVTDGFAATNNFLREIRDKVRTLDGTAVYA